MSIRFLLYEQNGITLRYTFPLVQNTNIPKSLKKYTEIRGFRGEGSLVITGSEAAWDIRIEGKINESDYDSITASIDEIETALAFAEPYYLKVDKNLAQSSQYSYKVKRILPIEWGENLRNGHGFLSYTIILRANSW